MKEWYANSMRRALGVLSLCLLCAVAASSPISFTDIASKAGLTAANVSGDELKKRYILEMNGSGVAFIDYDHDGYVDLFVVNGTRIHRASKDSAPTSHLYRNNGNGTFSDVTQSAGVQFSGWGQGACVGDYDNDGYDDLFVTYYGKNRLYHNNGNGSFTEVGERAGVAGANGRWNSGCAFVDYDRNGKLDLFVANYVDLGVNFSNVPPAGSGQFCSYKGIPIACGPRGLKTAPNYLFRNNGDGSFTDVSEASGIRITEGHYALGVLTLDYDNDGWPDIYVACDSAASILYHNNRDGTFTDRGLSAGVAFNEDGESQAGMGVAAADYDHDGFLDIVKTNFSDDSPNLFHNNGKGGFSEVVFQAGLGRQRSGLGWGALFADFDNDGWADILLVNGHLASEIDKAGSDSHYLQPKLLYRNLRNGQFQDISAASGINGAGLKSSRGAATGDIFNNGQLTVAVNEMGDRPSLLVRNKPWTGHWLGVVTRGANSNRDGIGARLELQCGALRQIDEVRSGGSYLSQNDLRVHFGLGDCATVERLAVSWPSGHKDEWRNIPVDRYIEVNESSATWSRFRSWR